MMASADTYFAYERGRFDADVPAGDALAAIAVPVEVMAGDSTRPFFVQASRRLAERLSVELQRVAGGHTAYHDHEPELAQAMRPLLREVSEASA
jgi:pimeloyl-ACP methyl ester carboxylesterase